VRLAKTSSCAKLVDQTIALKAREMGADRVIG
jgi:hypothetical protein